MSRPLDPADLPSGERDHLSRGSYAHCSLAHAGKRDERNMLAFIEDEMLIDLVANRISVVAFQEASQQLQFFPVEYAPDRIERRIDHDHLRPLREHPGERPLIDAELRRYQTQAADARSRRFEDRRIGIVIGLD